MLELRGVCKRFGAQTAVQGLSLTAGAGSTTVLIGPSGCGKSTLVRLMIGLVQPDSGVVLLDGTSLADADLAVVRRRMGYVIQEGGLFPHLTARGNITLMGRHTGWSRIRLDERLAELAELTRFPRSGLDRYPAQLSGGQRQRVSLMRALMLDPDVLLLDEPLGALDPMIRSGLQEELREIFATLDKTVVLVTHDIAEAGYLGDTIVLIREGQIVQQGSLAELVDQPSDEFVRRFINAQRGVHDGGGRDR